MLALSVHQPWAWAILHAGKAVENRSWATAHRGPLLVHASRTRASHDRQRAADWPRLYGVELPAWESLVTGAVVGVVEVVDCVRVGRLGGGNPWAEGPWCWVLANPRLLAAPVPLTGRQGLFRVPDELVPG